MRRRAQDHGLLSRILDQLLKQQVTPRWFRPWLDVEREATSLRTYNPLIVPGLLQTETYARALLQDDVRVAARMERQQVLDSLETYVVVMDECVLTRPVGSSEVMAEQVARLIEDGRAVVHVVPTGTGYYAGLDGAFSIATLDGAEVAVIDSRLRGMVADLPEDLAVIRYAWEGVRSEALSHRQSIDLLKEARERWKN